MPAVFCEKCNRLKPAFKRCCSNEPTELLECPECGTGDLAQCWAKDRKLVQSCSDCHWKSEPRTPEEKEIKTTKQIHANRSYGYRYELFDRYGWSLKYSRSYHTEEEAIEQIGADIKRGKMDKSAGPYKAVLWPKYVTVEGKLFV